MPILHSYRNKEGHYILAGVNGRIVTYRLSLEGARRLQDNSVSEEVKFSWAVLLELIRRGDAYTSKANSEDEDLSGWSQLGFEFDIPEHEPTQAEAVPLCACGSMEDLHIVGIASSKVASLLCNECRTSRRGHIDASVPIYLINIPSALDHLLDRSGLAPDTSVTAYYKLLNSNFAAKWQSKIRPKGKHVQADLLEVPEQSQQSLL